MRRFLGVIAALLILTVMLPGCSALEKIGLKWGTKENAQPASNIAMSEEEARKLNERVPVLLYFSNKDGTKLVAERRYILKSDVKTNLPTTIVKQLIQGPTAGTELKVVVPKGTRLNGTVKVDKGVATVDLSQEFIDNLSKDKNADSLAIFSIVNSLTEVKEISRVSFVINGIAKNQVGRFVFNTPFKRSESIIDKNAKVDTTGLPTKSGDISTSAPADGEPAGETMRELSDEELEETFKSEVDIEE